MLTQSVVLLCGPKVILVAAFVLAVVASGSIISDATQAVVSRTIFGF